MSDYTNEQLCVIMDDVREHLVEIKKQVTLTNGNVKSLQLWRSFLFGAWMVLSIIAPLMWYFTMKTVDSFNQDIDHRIADAIEDNNNLYFEK